MRNAGLKLLSSVGARVVALIVCATLPLAGVSAILAWHVYRGTVNGGYDRSQADLLFTRSMVINEVYRTRDALEQLSGQIVTTGLNQISARKTHVVLNNLCQIFLFDMQGKIIQTFRTSAETTPNCKFFNDKADPTIWLAPGQDPGKAAQPFIGGVDQKIYVRVALKSPYSMTGGRYSEGLLVGIKYFPVQAALDYSHSIRGDVVSKMDDLWLLSDQAAPLSLLGAHGPTVAWSDYAKQRIHADVKRQIELDHFRDGKLSYAFAPILDGKNLLSVTRRRPGEAHALDLFLARVAFIVFLLLIELALVALAAHFFLVSPLQGLARSVNQWRRTGRFNPTLQKATPSEISQMSRAFKRATRTLDRHEADIKKAMREQDILIKEIHHRVKNNLQIVASLLSLQARRINQPEARQEFQEVRERVRALATLHRHLYPDGGAAILELDAFLGELARQLYTVYSGALMGRVELVLDLAKVTVSADQAVPIALIVTELMTNAFAHAFPDERSGCVRLDLTKKEDQCVLTISDDGIGFNPDTPSSSHGRDGLGRKLVTGFVKQLEAEMTQDTLSGSRYVITFTVKPLKRIAV